MRKDKGSYKGKKKFNGKKGKKFAHGRHIRATERDDDGSNYENVEESSQHEEEEEDTSDRTIRAMLKKLSPDQRINLLINADKPDF